MVRTQLVASLREALVRGEWRDRLPSERTLCKLFLVSRSTLRSALSQLETDGILEIRHGSPTRIKATNLREAASRSSFKVCVVIVRESEEKIGSDQDFYHSLYYRFTKAHLACELLVVSERSFTSQKYDLQNWLKNDSRCLWLLMYPGKNTQQWFAHYAPHDTLVIGHVLPGINLPSIDCNHRAVGRHAAGTLLARGHRSIALFGTQRRLPGDEEGEAGFLEALQQHRDVTVIPFRHQQTRASIIRQMELLVRRLPDVTALFGYKRMAMMAAMVQLVRRGVKVPQQLSIVSRDYYPAFEHLPFSVASYPMLYPFLTREACKQALAKRRDPDAALTSVRLLPELREGNSIAKL